MYKTDLSTLILILAINKTLLGFLLLFMRRLTPSVRGVRHWGWGSIFTGFGLFVFSLSPWPSDIANAFLLNLFTLGGDVIFLAGFWLYRGKKLNYYVMLGFPTVNLIILVIYIYIIPIVWLRAGIVAFVYVVFYFYAATELLKFKRERLGRLFVWCAVLYFFYSFAQLSRTILYFINKPSVVLAENPFSILIFAAVGISVIVLTYSLIIIINARLNFELKEQIDTKNKLYAIIAHDLRGPIGNIMNYVSLTINAFETNNAEKQKLWLKELEKASGYSRMLLENLFSWSVNQLNEMHFNVKENDIQRVVNETITILKSQAEQKQISLSSNLSLPVFAYFDFETISIVLRNLITNALKFTPEGGQVVVSFVDKINSIEVFVTDNGVGISKDNFNILFCEKTFYSTRGTANEKGSGFGLLLCREFVERNGGTLKVDSTVGEGSTFSFSLPKVKP